MIDEMRQLRRLTVAFLACILFCSVLYLYMGFQDAASGARVAKAWRIKNGILIPNKYAQSSSFDPRDEKYELKMHKTGFNRTGRDVLVFVHIQKTAGTTFEKFLVRYLNIENPCKCGYKKRCSCMKSTSSNETWLFSRYSTGWSCGLHADYTELYVNKCVEETLNKANRNHTPRRYFYTTFLREPNSRFISEYRHVNRGATWITSRHVCNGRKPTLKELPMCFDPIIGWNNVTMDEFLLCPYNLAFNRQTRMLANLSEVGCYENIHLPIEQRGSMLLDSAKRTLKSMAFFGIKERMDDSQWLFETTFKLRFTRKMSVWMKSKSNNTVLTEGQLEAIRERNLLDIELYQFAVELFEARLQKARSQQLLVSPQLSTTG